MANQMLGRLGPGSIVVVPYLTWEIFDGSLVFLAEEFVPALRRPVGTKKGLPCRPA